MSDPGSSDDAARVLLERTFRAEHARVFAALVAALGDLDRAEEALQDAYAQALAGWRADALPERPAAWLLFVAKRRGLDRRRRDRARTRREQVEERQALALELHAAEPDAPVASELPDERLRLLFTCCHPALAREAQVALTLRAVSGLSTEAIARAFLVTPETMAQRLVRAKKKIREAGIPFALPPPGRLAERLAPVLAVVYLVFNEGYASSEGAALVRRELCAESIALATLLAELMPDEAEVHGLRGLLLLLDARRETRVDAAGLPLLLAVQERARWDRAAIAEGMASFARALHRGELGPYGLQAAIAAAHAEALRPEDTPWRRIVVLYDRLLVRAPTPVVRLNRTAALAEAVGAEAALAELDQLESESDALADYVWAAALRAELLLRLHRKPEAARHFERALTLAPTPAQRAHLERRRALALA